MRISSQRNVCAQGIAWYTCTVDVGDLHGTVLLAVNPMSLKVQALSRISPRVRVRVSGHGIWPKYTRTAISFPKVFCIVSSQAVNEECSDSGTAFTAQNYRLQAGNTATFPRGGGNSRPAEIVQNISVIKYHTELNPTTQANNCNLINKT